MPLRHPSDYAETFSESPAGRSNLEAMGVTRARFTAAIADAIERLDLEYELPISGVLLAADGSIWLRREDLALQQDSITWWVLNPYGDLVGELRLPRRIRIRYVAGDTLWAIDSDELEVDYLVRYRVRKQ